MAEYLILTTPLGVIKLRLRTSEAPETCAHLKELVRLGTFTDGAAGFYRSDFVIQFGVHGSKKPRPKLKINETKTCGLSNVRGTAAFAHWDIPDCGDTEIFINLQANSHLDQAYGGFCVFALIDDDDAASFSTVNSIAEAIPKEKRISIQSVTIG